MKRKVGRPKSKEPDASLGIHLPRSLREMLRRTATAEGIDSSKFIRRAILREIRLHDELYNR